LRLNIAFQGGYCRTNWPVSIVFFRFVVKRSVGAIELRIVPGGDHHHSVSYPESRQKNKGNRIAIALINTSWLQ